MEGGLDGGRKAEEKRWMNSDSWVEVCRAADECMMDEMGG